MSEGTDGLTSKERQELAQRYQEGPGRELGEQERKDLEEWKQKQVARGQATFALSVGDLAESVPALEHAPTHTVVRSNNGTVYESQDRRVGKTNIYLRYWFTSGVKGGKPSYAIMNEAPLEVLFVPEDE